MSNLWYFLLFYAKITTTVIAYKDTSAPGRPRNERRASDPMVSAQGVGGLLPCCGAGLSRGSRQDCGGEGSELSSVVNFACWNIAGWYHFKPKPDVITSDNTDVIGLVETHLRENESIDIKGFTGFGKKTKLKYTRRLFRGSGGVGFLVK